MSRKSIAALVAASLSAVLLSACGTTVTAVPEGNNPLIPPVNNSTPAYPTDPPNVYDPSTIALYKSTIQAYFNISTEFQTAVTDADINNACQELRTWAGDGQDLPALGIPGMDSHWTRAMRFTSLAAQSCLDGNLDGMTSYMLQSASEISQASAALSVVIDEGA